MNAPQIHAYSQKTCSEVQSYLFAAASAVTCLFDLCGGLSAKGDNISSDHSKKLVIPACLACKSSCFKISTSFSN